MGDIKADLEKEYCPPLDSALFHALLLDFDISTEDGVKEARYTLDAVRQNAEAEEATGFDPSGSSTLATENMSSCSAYQSSSHLGESSWSGASKSRSAFDSGRSEISETHDPKALDSHIGSLSFEDKHALLIETFPDISSFTVAHTLRKCGEDFEKSVDELLTTEVLTSDGFDGENLGLPKGAEAFAQNARFGKKKRGRKKKDKQILVNSSEAVSVTPLMNKWDKSSQEINFISERITSPASLVKSYYHAEGASLSKTILALSRNKDALDFTVSTEESMILSQLNQLTADFPDMEYQDLLGIVRLTYPLTAAAHELARAIKHHPFPAYDKQIDETLVPTYARLKVDDSFSDTSSDGSWTKKENQRLDRRQPNPAALVKSYGIARQEAFAKASAAYRKSRSNPLMGGVAGYYASIGRDAQAMVETYSAEAADALVTQQSTTTSIDLHGVDVANAVRIALERVEQWWTGGAAEWARRGRVMGGNGFSIVTGAGRHSQGGKGRLGPAVKKALVSEGWTIETFDGMILVRGKGRQ